MFLKRLLMNGRLVFTTALTCVFASCGGGTTGTSSTDSVKLAGYAVESSGARAGGLTMTVKSGATNQDLEDSGTNEEGDFSMELPASESSLVIDVDGIGSTTIQRQQQGAGSITTKLEATTQGTLSAANLFEVQIVSGSLCQGLTAEGTQIVVTGEIASGPCPVPLQIASVDVQLGSFVASALATCDGGSSVVSSARANAQGRVVVDLAEAFSRGCEDLNIVVSSAEAPGLRSEFSVQ